MKNSNLISPFELIITILRRGGLIPSSSASVVRVYAAALKGVLFGFVSIILSLISTSVFAQTEFTYPEYGDPGEARSIWRRDIITLALEATKDEYGPYVLVDTPKMKYFRAVQSALENKYKNFFFFAVYSDKTLKNTELSFIEFPIELGLLGYRVCLYSKRYQDQIRNELRSKHPRELVHGQVEEWMDAFILKSNGYTVVEAAKFDSLPKMAALRRIDLLCRGVNEVYDEWYGNLFNNQLVLDETFVLHYDMPVFIYTHRSNTEIIARLQEGLRRIYHDGSLHDLYLKHFKERLEFTALWNRRVVELKNPFVEKLSDEYRRYNVSPLSPLPTPFPVVEQP